MSTYTQIAYHIVFSPKYHRAVITENHETDLFRIITKTIQESKGKVYRINGMPDHLHILCSVHPTVCLSDFVKRIKLSSSEVIRQKRLFGAFDHWQSGYAAFTVSHTRIDSVIEYIKHQKEHHRHLSFEDEIRCLLKEAGIPFEEKYLFE